MKVKKITPLGKIKVEDFTLNDNHYHFNKPLYLDLEYVRYKYKSQNRYYCWEPIFEIYALGKTQESMLIEFQECWDEFYRDFVLEDENILDDGAKALKRELLEYCKINKG